MLAATAHDGIFSSIIPISVKERKSTCEQQAMLSYRLTSEKH